MAQYTTHTETILQNAQTKIKVLAQTTMGNRTIKERIIDNFDWFILTGNYGKLTVLPVWALVWNNKLGICVTREDQRYKDYTGHSSLNSSSHVLNPVVWGIPNFDNSEKQLNMPDTIYKAETNDYVKNFKISKDLASCGYEVRALCHGIELLKKQPISLEIANNIQYDKDDKIEDVAWAFAKNLESVLKEQNNKTRTLQRKY